MRFLAATLLLVACLPLVSAHAGAADDLLGPSRAALTAAQSQLNEEQRALQNPELRSEERILRYADLLLRIGRAEEALSALDELASLDAKVLEAKALLAAYEYRRAGSLIEELAPQSGENEKVRPLVYEWWTLTGDLARLEDAVLQTKAAGAALLEDRFQAADLKLRMLDYAGAYAAYTELAKADLDDKNRARAMRSAGMALYRLQRYPESLQSLKEALALAPLESDTVNAIADTLLRLGRIDDAIATLTFSLQLSPGSERAHQLLGSGYTRLNYTQLSAAYPDRFADRRGADVLRRGDAALQARRIAKARQIYRDIAAAHPNWTDVEVRLGSLEYQEGHFAVARDHYEQALRLCPEYGRAHEGYVRSIEGLRFAVNIHHEKDEAALEAAAMPDIPNIERLVLNWRSLSPRHQKRLALSLQPWERYIPALLAGGSTFYVKSLHQKLSELPHQQLLRDQRIDYDSRLWDDVRGVGDHHSVVGIEDIETRINNGYDTALHELSHQVHAVLSPEWARKIQALYARTKRRQSESGSAFLSQYAASHSWEYFAEGANALYNQRRDRFDTREIVFERLQERDPELLTLTREIMHEADVGPSYAAALVGAGTDELSRGKPRQADAAYRRALRVAPNDESALVARIHALSVMGRLSKAAKVADQAYTVHPESGAIVAQRAQVAWLRGEKEVDIVASLQSSREAVRADEQYLIDAMLGRLLLNIGDAASAQRAYEQVLAYQADDPQGLAGIAASEALSGNWESSWRHYDQALRVRAGLVELRVMYARDLIRANELQRAGEQIDAALLLDPEDPDVLAVQAWRLLLNGDLAAAREVARQAYERGSWSTLAIVMASALERQAGKAAAADKILEPLQARLRARTPPEYVYRSKWGRYDLVHTFSLSDRELLRNTARLAERTGRQHTSAPTGEE